MQSWVKSTNAANVLFIRQDGTLRTPLKSHSGEKSEPMQMMGQQVSRGII